MPWAGHNVILDLAFTQRAGLVQAQVVDGVKFVAETEQRHMAPVDDHLRALSGLEVADPAYGDEAHFRAAGVNVVSRFSAPRM